MGKRTGNPSFAVRENIFPASDDCRPFGQGNTRKPLEMAFTKLTHALLLLRAAAAALAPAAPEVTAIAAADANHGLPRSPAIVTAGPNSTCVSAGEIAATVTAGLWPITFGSVTPSPVSRSDYGIDRIWSAQHAVMTMNMGLRHGGELDLYGAFKCQFHCLPGAGCHSFFGRYVDVNTSAEHFECVGFDAVLSRSLFVPDTRHIAAGAFDQLCSPTFIFPHHITSSLFQVRAERTASSGEQGCYRPISLSVCTAGHPTAPPDSA
ncbi:hypothetical protein NKR23_g6985 [Pleurostoma richardsiae]|uniref:Uncharacterized protein n=1 Tax=Pleurostoma richardsiae TaxID=41990 RepID=A0AA38RB62_9PEZI|nr:hypothetical protein NKR23_g6985 [Pleurostoma richardsiae]